MAKVTQVGRPRDSSVWNYFLYSEDKEKSICQVPVAGGNICGKEINGRYPTNLKAHLKHSHPVEHLQMQGEEKEREKEKTRRKSDESSSRMQLKLAEACSLRGSTTPYAKESPRYKSVTKKLATFVAVANVSNNIVDNEEFRELITELDDRYVTPGRGAITCEMDKLLLDLKARLIARMKEAQKVAICVDIWSKKGLTASFLGVTAHFFTAKDHKRNEATLAVRRLASPHTAEHIESAVVEVLAEWDIPKEKISAILTDNGSNMIKAFREWLDSLERESRDSNDSEEEVDEAQSEGCSTSAEETDEDNGDVDAEIEEFDENELEHNAAFALHKRLSCFSHSLQLVVRKFDAVKGPKRTISNAHKIVSKVCKSVKATEKLVSLSGLKLVNDVPTRWNSTFIMISRLLQVRTELSQVLQDLSWNNLLNSEWKQLDNLHSLLEPFAKYTALTSGEAYTTLSMVIPVLMELNCHLDAMKEIPGLRHLASTLQNELNIRFSTVMRPRAVGFSALYVMATSLDPRYNIILNVEQLRCAKAELIRQFTTQEEKTAEDNSDPETETEQEEPPAKKSKTFHYLSSIIRKKQKQQRSSQASSPVNPIENEEIVRYLESSPHVDEEVDPLEFWIENEKSYPMLSPLACDLLTIPASSAPIERVFSTAGLVTSGKRNRLNDTHLEREILLKKNKKYL